MKYGGIKKKLIELCVERPNYWTIEQLAAETGAHKEAVRRGCNRYKLHYRRIRKHAPSALKERLFAVTSKYPKWTIRQIAVATGVSEDTIRTSVKRYGIVVPGRGYVFALGRACMARGLSIKDIESIGPER